MEAMTTEFVVVSYVSPDLIILSLTMVMVCFTDARGFASFFVIFVLFVGCGGDYGLRRGRKRSGFVAGLSTDSSGASTLGFYLVFG